MKKHDHPGDALPLPGVPHPPSSQPLAKPAKKSASPKSQTGPANLAKAIRLPVPDFSDPRRKPSCLEIDFPIARVNALSDLEGNAGKPIYQMSKWWARRRSSVFRAMLIAAAVEAPEDQEAAKLVWDHYYCNHQKAGSFKKLKVLDCFMGGGTTLVEGSRLGMQMTGIDLNPVAWFVVKNELACSDPEMVKALFAEIERKVKPQIQPFYATTCPRGHKGRWLDAQTGQIAEVDPINLPPEERARYRWEGPEIIYTFWAKHGPCQAMDCNHRTPLFRSPVIAQKNLSTQYLDMICPHCGQRFHADLGETRMAPGVERIALENEPRFTELSQKAAQLFKAYDKGKAEETIARARRLAELLPADPGLLCPSCGKFTGDLLLATLKNHADPKTKASQRKKNAFNIKNKKVQMFLLIHPNWLKGVNGLDEDGQELGGYADADAEASAKWYEKRLENLKLVEVRGEELPEEVILSDGSVINTSRGTIPRKANFTCGSCGKEQDTLEAVKPTRNTPPVANYALQCHCPQCEAEDYSYSGRYFKEPDNYDINRHIAAEKEWLNRKEKDLAGFWPISTCWDAYMMRANGGVHNSWNYTHWRKMFNPRQLLAHAQLLKAITEAPAEDWPLDAREQVLGALQQYLRNQNMFCFWDYDYDKLVPMFSNANFHPKNTVIENCLFHKFGRGNWQSVLETIYAGLDWVVSPWEKSIDKASNAKSEKLYPEDPIIPGTDIHCRSSTDLSMLDGEKFDLVITDPPFGNNLFYADLADFFYVWLRIPMLKWYKNLPQAQWFEPERTPHSMEAIDNPVEHPDDREAYEKKPFIDKKSLPIIREITGDSELRENYPNPLFRQEPSGEFYCQTLAACWSEAGRLLKDGGIMAFTFHHNEDSAWIDVLRALFDSGFVLVATYPIRSDESKGKTAAFGSQKIEYDIIHVCRKRLEDPEAVAWVKMRRWVRDEASRLKELLEQTHARALPDSDLRVILRGKALEFYSRHYGQVLTGEGQTLDVRDALLGINQLLDDILDSQGQNAGARPPDSAEPASRLFLAIFKNRDELARDDLHKRLRGTGMSQGDFEARGWLRIVGKTAHAIPIADRYEYFTHPGRKRRDMKNDLDQACFCMGAVLAGQNLRNELQNANFNLKKSVDDILAWHAQNHMDKRIGEAAQKAAEIISYWRAEAKRKPEESRQLSFFEKLEADS